MATVINQYKAQCVLSRSAQYETSSRQEDTGHFSDMEVKEDLP